MKQTYPPENIHKLPSATQTGQAENEDIYDIENERQVIAENVNPEITGTDMHKSTKILIKGKHNEIHNKLSVRELEIIHEICNGKKTVEIAKVLNLSKHTVESHRTNIFSKLDVRNVAELVALAFRVGLVV